MSDHIHILPYIYIDSNSGFLQQKWMHAFACKTCRGPIGSAGEDEYDVPEVAKNAKCPACSAETNTLRSLEQELEARKLFDKGIVIRHDGWEKTSAHRASVQASAVLYCSTGRSLSFYHMQKSFFANYLC
jgi:hypothetical protein